MTFDNKFKKAMATDPQGVAAVIDSDVLGQKAIPVVFVTKQQGGFNYTTEIDETLSVDNDIKGSIEKDPQGNYGVIDSDINGTQAIPLVLVTKNEDGEFIYDSFPPVVEEPEWDDIKNKPTKYTPDDHTHGVADITGAGAIITANIAENVAKFDMDGSPPDQVEQVASKINDIIDVLVNAGIMDDGTP